MNTLSIAFEDFILSREAALCSPQTIDFYQYPVRSVNSTTGFAIQ